MANFQMCVQWGRKITAGSSRSFSTFFAAPPIDPNSLRNFFSRMQTTITRCKYGRSKFLIPWLQEEDLIVGAHCIKPIHLLHFHRWRYMHGGRFLSSFEHDMNFKSLDFASIFKIRNFWPMRFRFVFKFR